MEWRKLNRAVHRDLGYFCIGLTILYAVTGFMLNHIHDWNPMYAISGQSVDVGRITGTGSDEVVAEALNRLGVDRKPISTFWRDETKVEIFFEGGDKVSFDISTGKAHVESINKRDLTSRLNDLHLNKPGGRWTFVADFYAIALTFLAISGGLLAIRKGSISRRGVLLTVAGVATALLSLLFVKP